VLSYFFIFLAPVLEGEAYYSAVCARAVHGELFWPAVLTCGALGGATGDQIWFYVLRGRIHWLDRYPKLGKYRDRVIAHVHAHENGLVLVSRFLPGLRTAIPIACAYAGMRALKFSLLNPSARLPGRAPSWRSSNGRRRRSVPSD
jgi:membrane protein DedA with SNARE-associated domain